MEHGAFSGKLSGAGASGFMMFLVKPEYKMQVKNALKEKGLNPEDVQFSKKGAISWEPKN
jgi:D-glycero-alpha-D-manno-heptose-7-phosphate kinase